jgi:hypothetical protein
MLFELQGIWCSAQSLIIIERFPVAKALSQRPYRKGLVAKAGRIERTMPHAVRSALLPDRRDSL